MSGKVTTVLDIHELLRHLREGRSDRAIHRDLGLARKTIAKYRAWAEQADLLRGPLPELSELQVHLQAVQATAPAQTLSSVEAYRATVQDLLERGLEVQAIHQRLTQDHGFSGHYQAVWRFVQKLAPASPGPATVRVETEPGQEAQVDFGYAGRMYDPVSRSVRRAWAFVLTLSWSRHQYVEFVFDQSIATWIGLHRRAFEALDGVPHTIKLDNLKAAILHAYVEDLEAQRAYRECAEHYGFLISPCRPRTPQHKGKVESGVHYVQRNFLAGQDFTTPDRNLRQANEAVRRWVRQTAGLRRHGTTHQLPLERFQTVEQTALRPLPVVAFEPVTWKQVKLHRDCYVVFEKAYYSAPCRYLGELLWLRATAQSVRIYRDFELLATHSRATAPGQRQTVLTHLPPEKVAGLILTPQTCQERAAQVGPRTAEAVAQLLAERPVDRLRGVHRLLNQAEREGAQRLERACDRALSFGDASLRTIGNILRTGIADQATAAPTPIAIQDWPRFARDEHELVPPELRR